MKIMIASDIHGSALYAGQLMARFDAEQPDRLLLLGDLLYHGPRNPLPEGYDPMGVCALLNADGVRQRIVAVRGNCDSEIDQMVLQFPMMGDYALLLSDGRTLFATHGHIFGPDNPPPNVTPGALVVSGHTHVSMCERRGELWFVNPGSVSLPKQNTTRGYMILEPSGLSHRALDGAPIAAHQI